MTLKTCDCYVTQSEILVGNTKKVKQNCQSIDSHSKFMPTILSIKVTCFAISFLIYFEFRYSMLVNGLRSSVLKRTVSKSMNAGTRNIEKINLRTLVLKYIIVGNLR